MTTALTSDQRTQRIRELNDRLRNKAAGGRIVATQGFMALPDEGRAELAPQIVDFDAFTEDNDPWGEHDFGAITAGDVKVFWKIDYYALDMMHGSEDPADPDKTVRVRRLCWPRNTERRPQGRLYSMSLTSVPWPNIQLVQRILSAKSSLPLEPAGANA